MRYCLVDVGCKSDRDAFLEIEKDVNKLIQKGWRPQGGVSRYEKEGRIHLLQAMVIDEIDKKTPQ